MHAVCGEKKGDNNSPRAWLTAESLANDCMNYVATPQEWGFLLSVKRRRH
jgi:hypothetical protein